MLQRIARVCSNELILPVLRCVQLHHILPSLPNHIMTFVFRVYVSQELYQATEQVHHQISELERIFPDSVFLKTQRALLFHHSKGATSLLAIQCLP